MKKGTMIGSILGGLFGTAAVIGGSMLLEKKQRAKTAEEDVSDAINYVVVEDTDSEDPADEAETAEG